MNRASIVILGFAALLTAAFHFFFTEGPFGLPVAIMVALAVLGIHVVLKMTGHKPNVWAHLFLIPLVLATFAKILYSSDVVLGLGFVVAVISLVFYAYWISVPRAGFWHVKSLWPFSFFIETIWPFQRLNTFFAGLSRSTEGLKILVGLLLAIPVLIIIGSLFASADPLFKKVLLDAFQITDFGEFFGYIVRDFFVGFFFLGFGWTIYTRITHAKHPEHREDGAMDPGTTIVATFLALVNLLFLVFLGFQAAYFFGGESFIAEQGLTYAQYARSGYFELLAVAGIVFGISWLLYQITGLRSLVTKILTCALIVQTFVIIGSAIKRLLIYIDAYGLTVSRWWAMATIFLIAAVLLFLLISALARFRFELVAKLIAIGTLTSVALLLLVNVEAMTVTINTKRYQSGKTNRLDIIYMQNDLSSDAIPALVTFAEKNSEIYLDNATQIDDTHGYLINGLKEKTDKIREELTNDWRYFTVSNYFAIKSAERL